MPLTPYSPSTHKEETVSDERPTQPENYNPAWLKRVSKSSKQSLIWMLNETEKERDELVKALWDVHGPYFDDESQCPACALLAKYPVTP